MRTPNIACGIALAWPLLTLVGCGQKAGDEATSTGATPSSATAAGRATRATVPENPNAPSGAEADTDRGSIEGTVLFAGSPPEMAALPTAGDPFCKKAEPTDTSVVVNDNGTLANVVVRIKPGTVSGPLPDKPVVISQTGCMYEPRVAGAMLRQPIQFTNADKTTHNIHAYAGAPGRPPMSVYNLVQPTGAPALARPAVGSGPMELKCDVHPWMKAYVLVSDHPYFATTRADGAFRIEGVPVGTHQLEAWHEVYGTKTTTVDVEKDGTATVAFSFEASGNVLK